MTSRHKSATSGRQPPLYVQTLDYPDLGGKRGKYQQLDPTSKIYEALEAKRYAVPVVQRPVVSSIVYVHLLFHLAKSVARLERFRSKPKAAVPNGLTLLLH